MPAPLTNNKYKEVLILLTIHTTDGRPLKPSTASFLSPSLSFFRYTYYIQVLYIYISFKTTFPSVKQNYLSVSISIIIVLLTVVKEEEHLIIFI